MQDLVDGATSFDAVLGNRGSLPNVLRAEASDRFIGSPPLAPEWTHPKLTATGLQPTRVYSGDA